MNRVNSYLRFIYMYMVKTWNIGPDNNNFVETETRSFATKIMKCNFFSHEILYFIVVKLPCYICYTRYNATCFKENAASLFWNQQNCKMSRGTLLQVFVGGGKRYHFPSPQQGQKGLTMGRHHPSGWRGCFVKGHFFQPCRHQGNGLSRMDKSNHCGVATNIGNRCHFGMAADNEQEWPLWMIAS